MKAFAVAVLAILLCVSFAAVSLAEETEWQLYSEEGTVSNHHRRGTGGRGYLHFRG